MKHCSPFKKTKASLCTEVFICTEDDFYFIITFWNAWGGKGWDNVFLIKGFSAPAHVFCFALNCQKNIVRTSSEILQSGRKNIGQFIFGPVGKVNRSILLFYTPWPQITSGFWTFWGDIEIEHCNERRRKVNRRKALSFISSRDHCQRSSPSRISHTQWAGFEPAQILSQGFVEWSSMVLYQVVSNNLLYIICHNYYVFIIIYLNII